MAERRGDTLPVPGKRAVRHGAARFAPHEKPRNMRRTLRRLWHYFSLEKKVLLSVAVFVALDGLVLLLVPYFIGLAVDQIGLRAGQVHFSSLIKILAALGLFYLADGFLVFCQGYLMASSGQRIVMGLRGSMFGKLQRLPVAFFDRHSRGDVMSRFTNDIENIDVTISQSTVQLMNALIMITGSLALMLWISPLLTAASLVVVPLVFILTRTIASRTAKMFVRQQMELGLLNGHIQESVSGLSIIKAFSHEEEEIKTFTAINKRLTETGMKAQVWSGYLMPLMNVINNLGFTVVASFGGFLAVKGMLSVGMIASFLTYSRQFSRPLNDVAAVFNTLQSAVAGAERVFDILDEPDEPADRKGAKDVAGFTEEIVFHDVSFGYQSDHPILKHIYFRVTPGETVALVGRTGAGKTTIMNLLTRFYDVSGGSVTLDGIDVRDYRRQSYRMLFGMVLQDTYLFQGSILENIRYGRPDATDEDVRKAAQAAAADGFIREMGRGYNTLIRENGANLSEGQRQLLTIARALLANPVILIMDEATSHVDTRTEWAIREGMSKLIQGRTCFIIAHRLSTIRHADQILVIDRGEIAERGTHRQLMEKKGIYYEMYQDQTAFAEDR